MVILKIKNGIETTTLKTNSTLIHETPYDWIKDVFGESQKVLDYMENAKIKYRVGNKKFENIGLTEKFKI